MILLAFLMVESAVLPSLSALCPKAKPGEIVVCADAEPPKSPYRLPLDMPPEIGTKESISVSRERNALFDFDAGGIGSCSTAGSGGASGCGFRDHRHWVEQRSTGRSGKGNLYDQQPY